MDIPSANPVANAPLKPSPAAVVSLVALVAFTACGLLHFRCFADFEYALAHEANAAQNFYVRKIGEVENLAAQCYATRRTNSDKRESE